MWLDLQKIYSWQSGYEQQSEDIIGLSSKNAALLFPENCWAEFSSAVNAAVGLEENA